jgi:hypothetical protein
MTNIKIKLLVICTIFSLFFLYRLINSEDLELLKSSYCFYDKFLLNATHSLNTYISQNLYLRDFTLLFSANCLDILMISFFFNFIQKGNSTQAFLSLIMFYGFRACLQNLFLFSFYTNYLFDYPGFVSFSVPFYRAADFFYSGHCGFAYILTLSLKDSKEYYFYYFGLFVIFLEFSIMTLVTRAHYIIDAIFGVIIGKYFYMLSHEILNMVNKRFKSKLV